jgi:hypothetical protein
VASRTSPMRRVTTTRTLSGARAGSFIVGLD